MPKEFDELFAVEGDAVIAKVNILIPGLLSCQRGTRLRNIQLFGIDLIMYQGSTIDAHKGKQGWILKNCSATHKA